MASRGAGFSGAPRHPGGGGGGWAPRARMRAIRSHLRTRGWSETEQFGRKAGRVQPRTPPSVEFRDCLFSSNSAQGLDRIGQRLNAHQSAATPPTSTTTEEPFHGSVIGVVGGQALSIDGCGCLIDVDYCPEVSEGV